MKKKILSLMLMVSLAASLAACGQDSGKNSNSTDLSKTVSDIEFAESKAAAEQNQNRNDDQYGMTGDDGFMNIPDGEELPPFN